MPSMEIGEAHRAIFGGQRLVHEMQPLTPIAKVEAGRIVARLPLARLTPTAAACCKHEDRKNREDESPSHRSLENQNLTT
jgi:hypothetical protein